MNSAQKQSTHRAIIFSGPSGAGKSTIAQHLIAHDKDLKFSVSACTRPQRPGEVDGQDYYFLSVPDFKQKIVAGAFAEWQEVYQGHYYGTLKEALAAIWRARKVAVFDIDVYGALRLKDYFQENALAVYVSAPSQAVLAERLAQRGTEDATSLLQRLQKATQEATLAPKFDKILLNEELGTSLKEASALLAGFLSGDAACLEGCL